MMTTNPNLPKEFTLTNYRTIHEKSEVMKKDKSKEEKALLLDHENIDNIDNIEENNQGMIQESKIDDKQVQTENKKTIATEATDLTKNSNEDEPAYSDIVDYKPDFSKNRKPGYPIAAKRMRQQGQTKLEIILDRLGNIINVGVKESSGYLLLDDAAVKGVKQWDLSFLVQKNKKTIVHTTISFTLRKKIE